MKIYNLGSPRVARLRPGPAELRRRALGFRAAMPPHLGLFSPGEVRNLPRTATGTTLELDEVESARDDEEKEYPYEHCEMVGGLFRIFLGGDPVAAVLKDPQLRDQAGDPHLCRLLRDVRRRLARGAGWIDGIRAAARLPGAATAEEAEAAVAPLVAAASSGAGEPVTRACCLEALTRCCEASEAAKRAVAATEAMYDLVHRALKSPLWRASAKHPRSPALRGLLGRAYPNYYEPEVSLGCRLLMHLLPCDPPHAVDLGPIATALVALLDGTRDAKRGAGVREKKMT